jgi:uncharacterized protein (TIGR02611 family)
MTRTDPSPRGFVARYKATRTRIRSTRAGRLALQSVVGVVGGAVIIVGIVLLPLPGPGWLVIFAGLGLLATEFEWASRLLGFARRRVSGWTDWVATRSRPVKALIGLAGLVVVAGAFAAAWWFYTR